MATTYNDLAKQWSTSAGTLSILAEEKLGLSPAMKTQLSDVQVKRLRSEFEAFEKSKTDVPQSSAPQLNPAPVRTIQEVGNTELPETGLPETQEEQTVSGLELAYQELQRSVAAENAQRQEIAENRVSAIADREYNLGVMQEVLAAKYRILGGMAARNALATSTQLNDKSWHEEQAEMMSGGARADFLNRRYANAAQNFSETPEKEASISQQTSSILERLKEPLKS
jgi:hypothetical protein